MWQGTQVIVKSGCGLKSEASLHLQSHYVLWVVLVLFPALITLNGYPEIKSRWRCEFVSLANWYLVAAGYVLTIMDLVVFADDRPDVLTAASPKCSKLT